ncbi:hypothetical protein D3093_26800 (plasmid) [Azospirillum argentinense]|uniref:Uncharacterized protein n=1 Tax=Azospirillum argentinense TaxID=2970906 RepID=A0A4D8PVF4_9PROT|nr:hypothetical protein [Azospirillum argentinense]QCN98899.1 hypothetical protein D3093_26800 [Azospirillum argentinense]
MTTVPPGLTPHILPGILREIAEIAGFQAAVDLCVAARGRRFYIPARSRLTKNHPLVLAVGWRAARLIADAYGHETLPIPTARPVLRAYRARVLRTAGYTTGQIAMILDMERGTCCGWPRHPTTRSGRWTRASCVPSSTMRRAASPG